MLIENITYINLKHRPDRNEWMKTQLSSAPYNYFRTEAVEGFEIPNGPEYLLSIGQYNRYKGVVGCFLSHKLAIVNLINTNQNPNAYSIIFEDDVYIDSKFWQIIDGIGEYVDNADIIFFDNANFNQAPIGNVPMLHDRYPICYAFSALPSIHWSIDTKNVSQKTMIFFGTHCIAIKNSNLIKILQELSTTEKIRGIDTFYLLDQTLIKYCIQTHLVFQLHSLGTNIPKNS